MKEPGFLSSDNMLITAYSSSVSELCGNSSKMERSSLYHLWVSWQQLLFSCCFQFHFISEWPLFNTDPSLQTKESEREGWAVTVLCPRRLTKKAGPERAGDKQVYDLCLHVIVLYGLLSPTNGSPRILDALLHIPHLCISVISLAIKNTVMRESWWRLGGGGCIRYGC